MRQHKSAFTLIELSIVLVIIGLIVAGILGAKQIMDASKLRALTQEAEKIRAMVNIFKLEYGQYPGDIDNAHKYWKSDCSTSSGNCNGDNDGRINEGGWSPNAHETHRAWQHLYLAGLTPQAYTGVSTYAHATSDEFVATANDIYLSQDGEYKFMLFTSVNNLSWPNDKYANYNGQLWLSRVRRSVHEPTFSVREAYYIDTLVDDGRADTGLFNGIHERCSAHINGSGADYQSSRLSENTRRCVGRFNLFP